MRGTFPNRLAPEWVLPGAYYEFIHARGAAEASVDIILIHDVASCRFAARQNEASQAALIWPENCSSSIHQPGAELARQRSSERDPASSTVRAPLHIVVHSEIKASKGV
jgi:hypothetical protein